ncbi:uncharacterized protein LOC112164271 [Rosa chinensis]|uniref:uncharacterized protein LOC112164271 n=1 Tax=Rosa chinensis TaxID=74649 RepID=UPI000D08667C|nr:uncharacterized protein LOC112164271 [Rosa chinensis]
MAIRFCSKLAFEYWDNTIAANKPNIADPHDRPTWNPPPPGYVAVNCDAAWYKPDIGGLGVVIRDENGVVIGGSTNRTNCGFVEIAEAQAVRLGVVLASDCNLKRVRFQSDSQLVISELLSSKSHRSWKILPIIEEIRNRSKVFEAVTWEWIPREANMVAHNATSLAMSRVDLNRWADRPPPSLSLVLRNDGLLCPPSAGDL